MTRLLISNAGQEMNMVVHTEIANKMQQFIKIYYSMLIWRSTSFGRHTAHHQEFKTALAASGFAYVKGCWRLSLLDAVSVQQTQRPTTALSDNVQQLRVQQPFAYAKPELLVQFWAPDDGQCVARNMLSFI